MNDISRLRYSLSALLRKREWDLNAARVEHANASQAAGILETEARSLQTDVSRLEAEMRGVIQAGATIDLDRQAALAGYTVQQRGRLEAKSAELARAERVREQTQRGLTQAARLVRVLERHRDREQARERLGQTRREERARDDLWLARATNTRRKTWP